eukprot:TRINITY_DN2193_c0_g2_i1.p1 TRINITY_DN2193_c0_g2~~TRINITY_DN2193_c0_g2_i1.p1  ORF type:complete len:394 (+),score=18.81 TRINITY_DN2193_c0_g2_i1:161-1342(+)
MAQTQFTEDFDFGWEERHDSIPYTHHLIAGSLAGIMEHCSMLPIDIIKTHIQSARHHRRFTEVLSSIRKDVGVLGFWKGASVVALGCVPAHAAYFTVYEVFKEYMKINDGKVHFMLSGLAGAVGTILHDTIFTPFDMLKQRKQLLCDRQITNFQLLRCVIKNEGLISLFRSVPITMLMNIPNAYVVVGVNDTLKLLWEPKHGHNFYSYLACAGAAGTAAAIATIPMDVIKTKLQTQNTYHENFVAPPEKCCGGVMTINPNNGPQLVQNQGTASCSKGLFEREKLNAPKNMHTFTSRAFISFKMDPQSKYAIKYKGVLHAVETIYKEEGMKGFTKGVGPRIFSQAPSAAISWATYESVKNFLNAGSHQHQTFQTCQLYLSNTRLKSLGVLICSI